MSGELIPLVKQDCGYVSAVRMLDNRGMAAHESGATTVDTITIVAYATRPDFRARIAIDVGDHLEDIPLAPQAAAAMGLAAAGLPGMTLPTVKQGALCLLPGEQQLTAYFTGRAEGNTGPYWLWKYIIDLENLFALDRAGVARVRNVARILARELPMLRDDLAPYLP